ncbi:pSer/pThr/pTyr-binding forkhead associated (FHA) protein [Mumia flava]|uniref:PSer/pThr/pTyr-binding forkhead associated (FHA) protein n=1 Tax=Mumia flava TaxID=1348852 RepID=A0A0B2B6K8_9ACTN|nr:FHA domain-containing protein [Mumia flava]PJJ57608.1 pSer/pThr/pTyr-binding forkhead associated (FHA) protein [Mumia flava]
MTELTLTLIKLGFLAVLWLFVLSAVSVIRSDVFGAKVEGAGKAPKQPKQPKQPKARKPKRGMPSKLVVTEGPNAGQMVPLTGADVLLGRGTDAAIRLDDDYVSTRHARFSTNGQQWFVDDMGSTNGTYVGSTRVTKAQPVPVDLSTPVRLGKTVVELRK